MGGFLSVKLENGERRQRAHYEAS
jgi:hypothetical protein